MKILIIGNIASGKTSFGKKIQEATGFKFVQIDELREKYLKNSVSGEYYSLYMFIKSIEENRNVILEFTGAGCHKHAIKRCLELTKDDIIIIVCEVKDFQLLSKRIQSKQFSYESIFEINTLEHAKFIQNELMEDMKAGSWEGENIEFIVLNMDTLDNFQEGLENVIRKL